MRSWKARYSSSELRDGDIVRVGQTIFKHLSGSNIETKYHEEIYRLTTIDGLTDGFVPGVKAFTAAVLGGIGSLPGAVIGGLLIGLIESLWSAYFTIAYQDVATFAILAFVLIFKPSGLLGEQTRDAG